MSARGWKAIFMQQLIGGGVIMKRIRIGLLGVWALLLFASKASASEYLFEVEKAEVTVHLNQQGTARIHYALDFICAEGAHPIDIVDIGMPNMGAHTATMARIDGVPLPLSSIQVSTCLEPRGSGYEVQLNQYAILPGNSGRFEFEGYEEKMVWEDTTDDTQVSFRFTPTWFGEQYVTGSTRLLLRVVLPIPEAELPAVRDKLRWHGGMYEFKRVGVMEGEQQVSVIFAETVSFTGPHMIGVSFPRRFVTGYRKDSFVQVYARWLKASPEAQFGIAAVGFILLAIAFFLSTRGSGWSVFLLLLGLGSYLFFKVVLASTVFLFIAAVLLVLVLLRRRKFKKRPYLAAVVSVEGGGVKRGLTAPLAALLLECTFGKVLTMVLFGLIRKGALAVVKDEPLQCRVLASPPKKGNRWVLKNQTLRLHAYEGDILRVLMEKPELGIELYDFSDAMTAMVRGLVNAMHGYDLEQSQRYYRFKLEKAWQQVKDAGMSEVRHRKIEEHFEWLVMMDDWIKKLDADVAPGRHYHPYWWRMHGGSALPGGLTGEMTAAATSVPTQSFSDVANSLSGQMETLSNGLSSSLDGFGLEGMPSVDLSGADRITADVLSSLFENSGGRSGGGGGGCACAGCACACACAGGGR
jgi:hypothetical protein